MESHFLFTPESYSNSLLMYLSFLKIKVANSFRTWDRATRRHLLMSAKMSHLRG